MTPRQVGHTSLALRNIRSRGIASGLAEKWSYVNIHLEEVQHMQHTQFMEFAARLHDNIKRAFWHMVICIEKQWEWAHWLCTWLYMFIICEHNTEACQNCPHSAHVIRKKPGYVCIQWLSTHTVPMLRRTYIDIAGTVASTHYECCLVHIIYDVYKS